MFLHLGSDILLNQEKIIAILDLETSTKGKTTEKFINTIKTKAEIKNISQGKEKSFIISTDGYYFSPISSVTLLKRSLFF